MTAGVFASPWISSDEHASSVHLPHFTANLKDNARRKFKGGVDAVIAELRLLQAAGGGEAQIRRVHAELFSAGRRVRHAPSYMPLANLEARGTQHVAASIRLLASKRSRQIHSRARVLA